MKGVVELLKAIGIWLLISVVTVGVGLIAVAIWAALVFLGAEERAAKAQATLDSTLMTGNRWWRGRSSTAYSRCSPAAG